MAELRAVIWDFDGTLVRTREASWAVFEKVNARFRLGIDTPADFYRLFEQNLWLALDDVCRDAAQAEEVKAHFRDLLNAEYRPELVPGIAAVVRALAAQYTNVVLTTNTMEAVRRVLLANDLAHCFAHVFSGDVSPLKHESIRRFLADPSYSCGRRCVPNFDEAGVPRRHDPSEVMLVTDTVGDVVEARASGIRVAAVAWGMHSAAELEGAGAEFVCIWPEELVAYLIQGQVCSTGTCSLPSAAPGGAATVVATSTPGESVAAAARRSRRAEAAQRLAARLGAARPGEPRRPEPSTAAVGPTHRAPADGAGGACCPTCATSPAECGGAAAGDPVLRQVLEVLAVPMAMQS